MGTWMFFPIFGNIGIFTADRQILEKELKVGCYSLKAFYMARTIFLLPLNCIWPFIWVTGVFWITNANPSFIVYVQVLLIVFLNYSVFEGVGQLISASGMNMAHASTLAMLLVTYWFAYSGFFIEIFRLHIWIRWVADLNTFRYSVHLMMHTILTDDVQFSCSERATINPTSKNFCESGATWMPSSEAKRIYGIDTSPALCLCVLFISVFVIRLSGFALLRYSLRNVLSSVRHQQCVSFGSLLSFSSAGRKLSKETAIISSVPKLDDEASCSI